MVVTITSPVVAAFQEVFPRLAGDPPTPIMHDVSDIATDPALPKQQIKGTAGADFTKKGHPVRYPVIGVRGGVRIEVIIEPAGEEIIRGYLIP